MRWCVKWYVKWVVCFSEKKICVVKTDCLSEHEIEF